MVLGSVGKHRQAEAQIELSPLVVAPVITHPDLADNV
jgi:hypothetical protein